MKTRFKIAFLNIFWFVIVTALSSIAMLSFPIWIIVYICFDVNIINIIESIIRWSIDKEDNLTKIY